ncbi:class I SAM-dependent methyltransferase [Paraburkholderia acidicola]|uniref:Class I SAM-dependent methyltransferase n=1 Tax=Paraburkholderia acidicola TaxID=1912599 RepID=A0ABV1LU16_9BURK
MSIRPPLDRINRRAWNSRDALREFTRSKTWTDPGEQAAFARVAVECRDQPLLDIGIGAGRTIPLMMQISSDYTGIDYTAKLLEQSRARFPDARLYHMDARDMSTLPSSHYALTTFSWNGIDCVTGEDRLLILREMSRVTRPGGLILFSSHNRDGPGFRQNIWQLMPRFTLNPLRYGWRILRTLRTFPPASYNYLRHVRFHRDYPGYSIRTAAAHDFGILIVYTTLAEQRRQLASLGLILEAVFGSRDDQPIADDTSTRDVWWFHFIARKPRGSPPQPESK